MRWLSALALLFGIAAGFASAQTPADTLRGNSKKIEIADLPESYRGVSFGTGDLTTYSLFGFMSLGRESGTNNDQAMELIGLMGVVLVDPDEFGQLLDGKVPRIRGYVLDLTEVMSHSGRNSGEVVTPKPVFTETWLEGGHVMQWAPRPGANRERLIKVFSAPPVPDTTALRTQDLSNVKQVSLGMMLYASDYDDYFPAADSTAKAKDQVMPYLKNQEIFMSKNPAGGRILYNTSLSHVASTSIERPDQTLLVWDEMPWPDGGRNVGFTDGHAKYLSAAEWGQAWQSELERRRLLRAKATTPSPLRMVPRKP